MSLDPLFLEALRVSAVLALALCVLPLLRRAPASARRLVAVVALGGVLVLPLVSAVAPSWRVGPSRAFVLSHDPIAEAPGPRSVALSTVRSVPQHASAPPTSVSHRLDAVLLLTVAWALGAMLVLARLAVGVRSVRGIARRATMAPSWISAIRTVSALTGWTADVRRTRELDAPAVTGIFAPVVLVPEASDGWSDARRITVLLHETAHVLQHDCIAQFVGRLACALHWYNPLVWRVARCLQLEGELAADDAVLSAGTRATSYADDLVGVAGEILVPAGALGMAGRSQLAIRIVAILDGARARQPLGMASRVVLLASALGVILAVACAAPGSIAPSAAMPTPAMPTTARASATLDPRIQRIADDELDRAVAAWEPAAATILVLDPATGALVANAGRAHGAPANVAVQSAYVTGSTLKAITLAAALEEGRVALTDRFDCENGTRSYGARTLHDWTPNGMLGLTEMMAVSSNVGFGKVFDRLGGELLGRWLRRFHFGTAPAIQGAAPGELPGAVADGSFEGAVLAVGEVMRASPLQVAAAYAVFANDGAYVAPTETPGHVVREQILRPETARAVRELLEHAIDDDRSTGRAARIPGVRVAGKTGTADIAPSGAPEVVYSSFVGMVPADHPRYVILVGVEAPRGNEGGGTVAAPVFARVASRALGD